MLQDLFRMTWSSLGDEPKLIRPSSPDHLFPEGVPRNLAKTGQRDPNITSDFALRSLLINRKGYLPGVHFSRAVA
jgi:hypothetical protein